MNSIFVGIICETFLGDLFHEAGFILKLLKKNDTNFLKLDSTTQIIPFQ